MSDLQKMMSSRKPGSWMVDELTLPEPMLHTKWAGELQQMRSHMAGQPGHYLLWFSIAGIAQGQPRHFKCKYLAPLMLGFYLPVMEFPLRNTKEVIKLAGLDFKDANRTATVTNAAMRTNPSYSLPLNLVSGVQCQQVKLKSNYTITELSKAIEDACTVMLQRTAGRGFPVIVDSPTVTTTSVMAAVQRVVGTALLYNCSHKDKNEATEAKVEEWLRRWKETEREERRALVTDHWASRGWEASSVLAIGRYQIENLVMRTCGFCFLIKIE